MYFLRADKNKNTRAQELHAYCAREHIHPTPQVRLCRPDTALTVVIPAYQEEKTIGYTLDRLDQTTTPIEIVIVITPGTDNTEEVVKERTRTMRHPLVALECLRRGPVYGRKRGMDEVVAQYIASDINAAAPRYIAMTDSDTEVPVDWAETILTTFKNTGAHALGGIYAHPAWVDQIIQKRTGIANFFGSLSHGAYELIKRHCAIIQTSGANAAIEIASYAAIDGSRQPTDEKGNMVKGSDLRFGDAVRAIGGKVAFLPTITITSARSQLLPLALGKEPSAFRSMKTWVDCRDDEAQLLDRAFERLTQQEWIDSKRLREISHIDRVLVRPLLLGSLKISPLRKLMGVKHPLIAEVETARQKRDLASTESTRMISRQIAEKYASSILETVAG